MGKPRYDAVRAEMGRYQAADNDTGAGMSARRAFS